MTTLPVTAETIYAMQQSLMDASTLIGEQRLTIHALRDALQQMLDLVEFAEMSSRDMEPYKFEAIRDGAERDARKAIAKATGAPQ